MTDSVVPKAPSPGRFQQAAQVVIQINREALEILKDK